MLPTRPSHTVPRFIIRLAIDGVNELTALASQEIGRHGYRTAFQLSFECVFMDVSVNYCHFHQIQRNHTVHIFLKWYR